MGEDGNGSGGGSKAVGEVRGGDGSGVPTEGGDAVVGGARGGGEEEGFGGGVDGGCTFGGGASGRLLSHSTFIFIPQPMVRNSLLRLASSTHFDLPDGCVPDCLKWSHQNLNKFPAFPRKSYRVLNLKSLGSRIPSGSPF